MNIDIKTMFPKASKSFFSANSAILTPEPKKNDASKPVEPRRGKRWPLEEFDYETDNPREIPNTVPQHHQTPALDSPNARKEKSVHRARVCFTGFRVRPLDPDNYAASCKDLLDGLRHAKLISSDSWWRIEFTTRQKKVRMYAEEKTLITIET